MQPWCPPTELQIWITLGQISSLLSLLNAKIVCASRSSRVGFIVIGASMMRYSYKENLACNNTRHINAEHTDSIRTGKEKDWTSSWSRQIFCRTVVLYGDRNSRRKVQLYSNSAKGPSALVEMRCLGFVQDLMIIYLWDQIRIGPSDTKKGWLSEKCRSLNGCNVPR